MRVFRQLPAWSPLTLRAILSGFRAAWLGGGQAARKALDEALRTKCRPETLYLTDSGTSALTLALQAGHKLTGAPVALPGYCCYDVATAADGADTPFLLYDIDPGTLSPALPSLRRALEAGARTIVVAHLYGVPVDLLAVQQLAAEYGAVLIEDAAQGSGCAWNGRPAGAHGALGVLSFGRGKGVTGGRGGALLVNDARLLAPVAAAWEATTGPREPRGTLRDYLVLKAQWLFGRPSLYWIPASLPFLGLGETRYQEPHPIGGISALAAGVLLMTLPMAPEEEGRRRVTAARLRREMVGTRLRPPTLPPAGQPGYLRFPVLVEGDASLSGPVTVRLGIMPGYPRSLDSLDRFGLRRQNGTEDLPGALLLAGNLWTLPTHGALPDSGLRRLEGWCRTFRGQP